MASSSKTTPVKGKEGKREWSESRERPWEPRELVPTKTNELALLLRVQRKGGWGLECIALEAFNGQVICQKVKQVTGIEPLSVDLVNDVDIILELPNDALVTRVGQELQKVVEWGAMMSMSVHSWRNNQSLQMSQVHGQRWWRDFDAREKRPHDSTRMSSETVKC